MNITQQQFKKSDSKLQFSSYVKTRELWLSINLYHYVVAQVQPHCTGTNLSKKWREAGNSANSIDQPSVSLPRLHFLNFFYEKKFVILAWQRKKWADEGLKNGRRHTQNEIGHFSSNPIFNGENLFLHSLVTIRVDSWEEKPRNP